MRFYHLLHFLGAAFAAPSKADSLSLFDNPTIPWNTSDSLSLPVLSHVRRAGTSTLALNVTVCRVTVTMDPYRYQNYKEFATLYIISRVDSPGTKNGANVFDMFFRVGSLNSPGSFVFATNEFVMGFGTKPLGPKNIDYARTVIDSTGAMRANVDYANLDRPEANSPLKFNIDTVPRAAGAGFVSPAPTVAGPNSAISVSVKDQGAMTGQLIVWPLKGGMATWYYLNGFCSNSLLSQVPVSS
ncbi:hypothetical protein DER45DRAFT_569539 [Fusarium avenaceum]|nr:hypothetical protein DER45DRAFT_569539 [Fusarium avenaceum]